MENINAVIEKLMLNRAALLMKRYDNELKEILENDLQSFRSGNNGNTSTAAKSQSVA